METTTSDSSQQAIEEALYRKVAWRLIPLLLACYVVAYLDRVNVGFAKLQMMDQLGFSDTIYGLGAGMFFIGYFLFEVPSNIILHKMGARVWIG
ncbi:MAG: tartrate transporter TtuB, partial [Pseudomonadota bacterium]